MMWVNKSRTRILHALSLRKLEKEIDMTAVYVPDGFSLKYSMSNLIDASQRGTTQRVQKKHYIC